MRVTTLGMLAVDGEPVRGERLAAVVRMLLDARGRPVPASSLVDAIWGIHEPRDATGAVQALVSRVRRLGLPVLAVPGGYRLPIDELSVDAVEVGALVERARAALRDGDPRAARSHADAARALLPAVPDVTQPTVRATLHEVAIVRARAALSGAAGGGGDEEDLRLLAQAAPPDEQAAELLVRLLAAAGRGAEALEFVASVRRELAERYGADLSPALAAAHVALLRGELTPAAPEPPEPPRPRAVPLPAGWRRATTPLLGRDPDITEVTKQLADTPLVTLVGPGGAGKTRLAAELARRRAGAGEPVRVVELAGLRAANQVAGTVASAIDAGEPTPRPGSEGPLWTGEGEHPVRRAARDLSGLVVLDNCEHVLDAAADAVAQILAVAPQATVLATSRAPLGLPGEAVHRLRALDDDDAVALLQARAQAGGATLSWPHERLLELCHRLDNLPLALELAAARLRHMPIDDVLAGLANRFGLLDEALRGLPERHASLWAMVDWSHELLPPEQRELWWRLAVIPGPFTVDCAAAVAGRPDVRAGLAMLVEQSLLALGRGDDGVPRYRMLETVREYGEVRLDAAGERTTATAGLVRWAADQSAALLPDFIGPAQVPALARCTADADTLVAALRAAIEAGDEVSSVDICSALFHVWSVQGRHRDVVAWASRLLRIDDPAGRRASALVNGTTSGAALPDADRLAWTLLMVSANSNVIGVANRLGATARRALRHMFAQRGDELSSRNAALAGVPTSMDMAHPDRDMATATAMVDHPDTLVQGYGLFLRSILWENQGEVQPALADNLRAFERFETVGDQWMMGMAAQATAARLAASSLPGSSEWLRRGAAHLAVVGATEDARSLQIQLDVQLAIGGDEQAFERLGEAATGPGSERMDTVTALAGLAEIAIRQGRPSDALAHIDAMVPLVDPQDALPQAVVIFRATIAVLGLWAAQVAGDEAGAREADRLAVLQLRLARDPALSTGDIPALGVWVLAGAELAAHRGSPEVARELVGLALRLSARVVYPFQEGYSPRLTVALGEGAEREQAQARWRNQPQSAVTARARELMTALLD